MKYKMLYKALPLVLATVTLVAAMAACKKNTDKAAVTTNATNQPTTQATEYTAPSQVITVETPDGTTSIVTQEGVTDWGEGNGTTVTPSTNPSGNQQTGSEKPATPGSLTIEQYEALSTAQQQAYFQSFATVDAFYEWLEAAEAARKPGNSVTGDGNLDLGDHIGNR